MMAADGDELRIRTRVTPRAAHSELQGMVDGMLRIRTTAAPADGAANKDVIKQLAKAFGVPKSAIVLLRGESSRIKDFVIHKPTRRPTCLTP